MPSWSPSTCEVKEDEQRQEEEVSHEKDEKAKFPCILPTIDLVSNPNYLYRMWASHDWQVDRAEVYAGNGVLTRIHCKNCGLEQVAIHVDILESAKRSALQREKRKK